MRGGREQRPERGRSAWDTSGTFRRLGGGAAACPRVVLGAERHMIFVEHHGTGRARRHPTDFIHPLNYLDFKLRTDNWARWQGLAGRRLPTEARGATCGPRPRTGGGRLQAARAGSPASAHSTRRPRALDSGLGRWAPPAPLRRDRSPDHRAGLGLLPPCSSGGCRGRGAAPHPARALPRSLQTGLSAAK